MKQLLIGVFSVVVFSASAELAVGHHGFFGGAGGSLSGAFHHAGGVVSGATHHAGGVVSGATHHAMRGVHLQPLRGLKHRPIHLKIPPRAIGSNSQMKNPFVLPKLPYHPVAGIHANPSSAFQHISKQVNAWNIDPGVRGSRLNPGPAVNYAKQKAGQLSQKASQWNIDRTTGKVLTGIFGGAPNGGNGDDIPSGPGEGMSGRYPSTSTGEPPPEQGNREPPDDDDKEDDQANTPQQVTGAFLTRSPSARAPYRWHSNPWGLDHVVNRSAKSLLRAGQVADHRRPVR